MDKLFKRIGSLIDRKPVKTLLATIVIFAILIAGVSNMRMATGNETLVQGDNEVYKSNKQMEDSFGGDSVLVLFTDNSKGNLLSHENIQKMWNVEQKFKYEDNIFSFMSPASIVHQMTEMQSIEIKKQVLKLSDGLDEMSSKMIDVGNELNSKDIKDPKVMQEKLNGLSQSTEAFNKLIVGQDNLTEGVKQIQGGLFTAADGLGSASNQLEQLSKLAGGNVELKMKLNAISENINVSSEGIRTIGEKTTKIQEGTKNTSKALTNISGKLTKETSSMREGLTGGISPAELKEMAAGFITMGEKLQDVSKGLRTFHTKSNMMIANIPGDQSELDNILYDENHKMRSVFSDVVIDNKNSLMVVKLQGNLGDEYKDKIAKSLTTTLDNEGFKTISYVISGKPVLDSSLRSEMKSNMVMMVGLAVLIMFIILAFVFKVRWRMLSLGIILVSVIATLGFMGILIVPITMVSMAVFPILIGLGIDYSIQFHNRYEEERSVKRTMSQMGKAVAIAVFATVLGFISLYASPVPMIQDFGKMLTIGVIISFLGAVFLIMPILHLREKSSKEDESNTNPDKNEILKKETSLDRILKNSTKRVIRFSIPILIIVIGLSFVGFLADKHVGVETDIETFMPQDMQALKDIHSIRDKVGSTDQIAIFIKDSNVLTGENISWIQAKTKDIGKEYGDIVVGVKSIDTLVSNLSTEKDLTHEQYIDKVSTLPKQQVNMFVNDGKTQSVILLNIKHLSTEKLQDFIKQLKDDTKDTTMEVQITGKSALDVEMVNGLTSGRVKMTIIGLVLVFAALLVIYRNPFKALIPILPVVLIIGMSSGLMYLLGIKYTPITATLGALVLGMGTEMTVMLLERYLEERKSGKDKLESMIITVTKIGKAIVASGFTTVGGFSVLMASQFIILKDFGLMTVINITLALLSTFVVLPPIIILLDRFILSKSETLQN
jgi:hydrophobe/amphiphile efflux-3 (HAE3) family protein